jgi:ribosome maturation factor RimP
MDYKSVENIVNEVLGEENAFLVHLELNEGNSILLNADSFDGMDFQRLKMVNRKIEALLDREVEDFSIVVSSPGLDKPLKVHKQYLLNVDRSLRVTLHDREILIGKLTVVDDDKITLVTKQSKKVKSETHIVAFQDILEAKVEIEF